MLENIRSLPSSAKDLAPHVISSKGIIVRYLLSCRNHTRCTGGHQIRDTVITESPWAFRKPKLHEGTWKAMQPRGIPARSRHSATLAIFCKQIIKPFRPIFFSGSDKKQILEIVTPPLSSKVIRGDAVGEFAEFNHTCMHPVCMVPPHYACIQALAPCISLNATFHEITSHELETDLERRQIWLLTGPGSMCTIGHPWIVDQGELFFPSICCEQTVMAVRRRPFGQKNVD